MRIRFLSGITSGMIFIIIVFMTIALAFLGYSSMTIARESVRLAEQSAMRNQTFYYLDGMGVEFIAHMDAILLDAQNLTNEYIISGSYRDLTHPDLSLAKQTFIREGFGAAGDGAAFLEPIIDTLFFFYAQRELERLRSVYPSVVITAPYEYLNGFDNIHSLLADITLTHHEAQTMHLSITLSVINYNVFSEDAADGNVSSRVRITSWRLWESLVEE